MKVMNVLSVSFFAVAVALVTCGVACSPGTDAEKSGSVGITFPSSNAAIATDTIELRVYDSTIQGNDCLTLVESEQKTQPLPKPIYDSGKINTCTYLANGGVKPFDMGYGSRSFLVVGQRAPTGQQAADFMIGCSVAGIGDVSNSVNVDLSVFDPTSQVPDSTKCASLSDRCTKNITCY
jgi:hypothetical protein